MDIKERSKSSFRSRFFNFNRDFLDPDTPMQCLGIGDVGGKAEGLAYISNTLHDELKPELYSGIKVEIPPMVVLCTDVFDAFMAQNHLYDLVDSNLPRQRIAYAFQKAELPFEVLGDLRSIVEQVYTPLAVRSSSLLEDTMDMPFAGIYATKMIPNNQYDPDIRFRQLVEAVKFVYASTFTKSATNYRKAIGHGIQDEKMAVVIQELVGKRFHKRFYPEMAGVARSYNYYPMKPARPEDGVVNLALGLGKTVVEGGISWGFSPAFPKAEPPFGSVEDLLRGTQTEFWAVNMGEAAAYDPTSEEEYLVKENIAAAEEDNTLRHLVSTYNSLSERLSIGTGFKGPRALTFAPLLILNELPVISLLKSLLSVCQEAYQNPVEIEFAMTFDPNRFGLVQVRSMASPSSQIQVAEEELSSKNLLLASDYVLGNGVEESLRDIVYIRPESFDLKYTKAIVPELEQINNQLLAKGIPYLLIVFGRLGTVDPWLGIPMQWAQVCGAKVIVEATQENAKVELSQGSHYFHNMINLGIKYFSLPFNSHYKMDWDWLNQQPAASETRFLRHIRLDHALKIRVDGRHSRGVIEKG
jgi:hypothetical protein